MIDPILAIITNRELIANNIKHPNMTGSLLVQPYITIQGRNYIGVVNEGYAKYYYKDPTSCTTKWYHLQAGHSYLIMASANPGTQFRWVYSDSDIAESAGLGAPDSIKCESLFSSDSPCPYINFIYNAILETDPEEIPEGIYIGGTIDNNGNYNTDAFVFDITSLML